MKMTDSERIGQLVDWAELLVKQNKVIIYTPFFHAVPVERDGFNHRHMEKALEINPQDIVDKNWDKVKRLFLANQEYICGFDPDLRPVEADKFVYEMLTPEFSFMNAERGVEDDEFLDTMLHRCTNASMVIDCIDYAFDVLCMDANEPDMVGVLTAPCFNGSVVEILRDVEDAEEFIEEAYMGDKIKRYD